MTQDKLEQPKNAPVPILTTLAGIITEVILVQSLNASVPIFVTLSAIISAVTSAMRKVAVLLPVRHAVVPALVETVRVEVVESKLHPSPEKSADTEGVSIITNASVIDIAISNDSVFFILIRTSS
jgi:hypothetical protein